MLIHLSMKTLLMQYTGENYEAYGWDIVAPNTDEMIYLFLVLREKKTFESIFTVCPSIEKNISICVKHLLFWNFVYRIITDIIPYRW